MPRRAEATGRTGFVLQQMNETQASFVFTRRPCAREFWFEVAATVATAVAHQQLRAVPAVATYQASRRTHRLNGLKTFGTDGSPGEPIERGAVDSAIQGEKSRKNAAKDSFQGRDKDGTLLGALFSSFAF